MSERLVAIGEVVTTHGLEGWLKLNPFNPETTVLYSTQAIFLEKDGHCSSYAVEASKRHQSQFLVKLRDVNAIDAAEKWVGAVLYVDEAALGPLKPGEYYHYTAIGFDVFDLEGNRVGVITGICSTPGGELYVVQGPTKEHLIPAVKEIIEKVDFTSGKIIINPPDGLLDL